jgi:uncharacterized protein YhaN
VPEPKRELKARLQAVEKALADQRERTAQQYRDHCARVRELEQRLADVLAAWEAERREEAKRWSSLHASKAEAERREQEHWQALHERNNWLREVFAVNDWWEARKHYNDLLAEVIRLRREAGIGAEGRVTWTPARPGRRSRKWPSGPGWLLLRRASPVPELARRDETLIPDPRSGLTPRAWVERRLRMRLKLALEESHESVHLEVYPGGCRSAAPAPAKGRRPAERG